MEHHWANMRYWLWRSVIVGIVYLALTLIFGDELIAKAFDVRMDHYTRTTLLEEKPYWHQSHGANETAHEPGMWRSVKEIELSDHVGVKLPRLSFLAWHAVWCMSFFVILMVDKCRNKRKRGGCWAKTRSWVAFSVMFLDLLITSFLNPSVARFMTFVYAVLVRTQFSQTLCLVLLQSIAMLAAGYVGSHSFLSSVSVAEFCILNFVCILASHQTEIHARLSLYRLWYIVKTDQSSSAFHAAVSETTLAKNLLSLAELKLPVIPEESVLFHQALGSNRSFQPGLVEPDLEMPPPGLEPDLEASPPRHSPSPPGTPCSSESVGSSRRKGSKRGGKLVKNKHQLPRNKGISSPRTSGSSAEPRPAQGNESDSDIEKGSNESDIGSGLPPWLCLEVSHGSEGFTQTDGDSLEGANCWSEVSDVDRFSLRGKTYINDKLKVPATQCAFRLHQARMFATAKPLTHAADVVPSLKAFLASCPNHLFFIYNRIIPYKDGKLINCITLLVRQLPAGEDPSFDTLWNKFMSGTDDFRNARLKHLSKMREAPAVVTNAIWWFGGEKPVIIGKGYLEQKCFRGSNYVEVDVDISGSKSARMVVGKVLDHGSSVVMEEMICLEGQSEEELPERPLGAWRWHRVSVDTCLVHLPELV